MTIRRVLHHLIDQAAKRGPPRFGCTAATHQAAPNIPGRQILHGATTLIFRFDAQGLARWRRHARVAADAGLDTCFFVATDDKIMVPKRLALPDTRVHIQDRGGFGTKVGIARENPVAIAPGLESVAAQNASDAPGTDRSVDHLVDATGDISGGLPTQGLMRLRYQLARGGLDRGVLEGGKSRACVRDPAYHQAKNRHWPIVVATSARPGRTG